MNKKGVFNRKEILKFHQHILEDQHFFFNDVKAFLRIWRNLYSEPHKSWPPFSEAGGFLRCQVGNALRPPPLACREIMAAIRLAEFPSGT